MNEPTYHYWLSRTKQRANYIRFYNRVIDMYISNKCKAWPPSLQDIYGSELYNKEVEALEHAVSDAVRDIFDVTVGTHPTWAMHGASERSVESLRLWREDEKIYDYSKALDALRIEPKEEMR